MRRGTVVGIDDDPDWAETSEYEESTLDAYHWGPLLEIKLPGVLDGPHERQPSVCVERFDRVTDDRQHQIVGDYAFVLGFDLASTHLTSPEDLDVFADRFHEAANKLRAFMATEGVEAVVTERPRASGLKEGQTS